MSGKQKTLPWITTLSFIHKQIKVEFFFESLGILSGSHSLGGRMSLVWEQKDEIPLIWLVLQTGFLEQLGLFLFFIWQTDNNFAMPFWKKGQSALRNVILNVSCTGTGTGGWAVRRLSWCQLDKSIHQRVTLTTDQGTKEKGREDRRGKDRTSSKKGDVSLLRKTFQLFNCVFYFANELLCNKCPKGAIFVVADPPPESTPLPQTPSSLIQLFIF